jgi:iron complex outermembrane receptor protein
LKISQSIFLTIGIFYHAASFADNDWHSRHDYDEEIVVSAPFQLNEANTALPINVLTGEALGREVEDALGVTLRSQIGIHNTSFGPGVGQAVIRGQSGNRVQVLQNSVSNVDVSSVSPDHVNGVEPALASRIEVIRGPSTLLYGNGAIGGIVNVIDDRILETALERPEFLVEQSHNSVNEGNKTVAKLNATFGVFNFHLDAFKRDNHDVEIGGFAIEEAALKLLEEVHEEEEIVNSKGYIANSDAESDGLTFGTSLSSEQGFIGFAVSTLNNEYGLPRGTHGHHDEEHGEDGEEFVRIDMEQTRYDLKGEFRFESGFLKRAQTSINYTDYEHLELEIEPDGATAVGSAFSNKGYEGRFTGTHTPINQWEGIWGVQFSDTEFSALGEEAFIPKTDSSGFALFAIERIEAAGINWEFGYRYEHNETDPGKNCDRNESTHSLSASMLYDLNNTSNMIVAVSISERAPTLEERYSNVDTSACAASADPEDWVGHAATGLLEIGDPDLGQERAMNIEIGFRKHSGKLTGEFSVYYNQIQDYIYLQGRGKFKEQTVATYTAEDAEFFGAEGRVSYRALQNVYGELDLSLQGDLVRAEFEDSGDVPRIPPARLGASLSWHAPAWSLNLSVTEVFNQKKTAIKEFKTDGYTLLELYADYHVDLRSGELLFFAKGNNLMDDTIRNHTSFLKNFAPEPGRGVRFGIRYTY